MRIVRWAIFVGAVICTTPTYAARCGGDFNTFIAAMSQEARAAGISDAVISQAFAGVTQDPAVLAFDRRQRGTFNKSFEQYVSTRVGPGRINIGRQMLQRHASLLSRIEKRFGVPPEIVVAIWGLESDFGKGDVGKLPVIRTLATMAHDCRRTELFQGELLAALKIVQRGDLPLRDLIGAFAGEIGQTQFLPSSYIKYGVDFDDNGHVDLRHSVPDVLASTANLLHTSGFKGRRAVRRGNREFRSDARVEQGHDLPQDDRVFCRSAGGAVGSRSFRGARNADPESRDSQVPNCAPPR
jgi:lytic murein transglycosylase